MSGGGIGKHERREIDSQATRCCLALHLSEKSPLATKLPSFSGGFVREEDSYNNEIIGLNPENKEKGRHTQDGRGQPRLRALRQGLTPSVEMHKNSPIWASFVFV